MLIGLHLVNHLFALAGPQNHIWLMETLRIVYRYPIVALYNKLFEPRLFIRQKYSTKVDALSIQPTPDYDCIQQPHCCYSFDN